MECFRPGEMGGKITSEIKENVRMDNTNAGQKVPDNTKLEEVLKAYAKEQTKENLSAVLNSLRYAHLFAPAIFPEGTDLSFLKEAKAGERLQVPQGVQPIPSVLKNQKGEIYLPLYTKREEIPKDSTFHTILEVTFRGSYMLVLKDGSKLEGLALNPFRENIIIKKQLLEKLRVQDDQMLSGKKVVKLSAEQYRAIVRRSLEQKNIPQMFFEDGDKFTKDLREGKEAFIKEIYLKAFAKEPVAPYTDQDFDFMALNVREDLLLIRIDLPEKGIAPGHCHRVYLAWNEQRKKAYYFTIEKTPKKEERVLGRVDETGKRTDYGIAPVEGAEIQRILDIIDEEKIETN